ncbi:MAG TPA: hypothetical protein VHM01_04495 [Alphaproteobacteria bacterium]|nr:hypothetical protein [Alphaproteobacteria bacterium]
MQPSDLRQEVAAVFGEIVAAKRLVRSGRTVELDGLDKRIGILCEAIVALPSEDGRAMLPLLGDLRASLDELAEALKAASPGDCSPSAP